MEGQRKRHSNSRAYDYGRGWKYGHQHDHEEVEPFSIPGKYKLFFGGMRQGAHDTISAIGNSFSPSNRVHARRQVGEVFNALRHPSRSWSAAKETYSRFESRGIDHESTFAEGVGEKVGSLMPVFGMVAGAVLLTKGRYARSKFGFQAQKTVRAGFNRVRKAPLSGPYTFLERRVAQQPLRWGLGLAVGGVATGLAFVGSASQREKDYQAMKKELGGDIAPLRQARIARMSAGWTSKVKFVKEEE